MEQETRDAIKEITNTLQHLLLGKPCSPISETEGASEEVNQLVELVNMLSSNLSELNSFARELARGNLDVSLPGRRNYLAGTLKELHAQLSSFVWSVNQLQKGSVVERMDYRGEISDALNALIARMVDLSAGKLSVSESASTVNSWQFHQVYLAINHMPLAVVEVEHNGRIVFTNKRARELLKDTEYLLPEQAPPQLSDLVSYMGDPNTLSETLPVSAELYAKATDTWYKVTTDRIIYPDGRELYLHMIDDISSWKTSEQKLQVSATVDDLTGVYNRAVGMDALEDALQSSESAHCVAFIDIDGLKAINDVYGHHEGDYAISNIAQVLSGTVRASDTISRVGGDEFLIVFRDCTMSEAEHVIARMLEKVEKINKTHSKPFQLSFSHGLVQVSAESDISVNEIIMLADKKMYERKSDKKRRAMLEQKSTRK